jgi:hypothetical protein
MIITTKGPQNIGQLHRHFTTGNLFLSPEEYQRENAWNLSQKRLLIDTIFRGMDIPKFYLWKVDLNTIINGYPDGETKDFYRELLERKRRENDDPDPYIFEVVDGQQRTRSILEYMGVVHPNEHVYRGVWGEPYRSLDETPMAKGKKYAQLNAEQQIKFDETPLTIMILENANIDEIRDMFLRLQNGTPLNAQQKRDAMGSKVSQIVRELTSLSFFTTSVAFDNKSAAHHLVASQMIYLEFREKISSCTSQQLDKFYKDHKSVPIEPSIERKAKKVVSIMGKIFPDKNHYINRSYALSLYFALSKIIDIYNISEVTYSTIRENFEALEHNRLEAMQRDYSEQPNDEIYSDLSLSMSRRTDGEEGISDRHDILMQFLFNNSALEFKTELDPRRNFTYEEKLILYRRAKGCCQLEHNGQVCGRSIEFEDAVIDHILPHSKGGRTSLDNGRLAYKSCNIARGNRDNFDPATMCLLAETTNETV